MTREKIISSLKYLTSQHGCCATWQIAHYSFHWSDTRKVLKIMKKLEKEGIARKHFSSTPNNYVWEFVEKR